VALAGRHTFDIGRRWILPRPGALDNGRGGRRARWRGGERGRGDPALNLDSDLRWCGWGWDEWDDFEFGFQLGFRFWFRLGEVRLRPRHLGRGFEFSLAGENVDDRR
jgi:hypothetical protein